MTEHLEIRNFNLHIQTHNENIQLLHDICLDLHSGEIVGLVGESGSGKSLTAQSILQLHSSKKFKLDGQINFKGQNLLNASTKQLMRIRGKEICYISQDPNAALNPTMKIGAQLLEAYQMQNPKMDKKSLFAAGVNILKQMHIQNAEERMSQYPHELSGGMKQRVLIAMSLICQPKFLIADELTTALDVTVQAEIMHILKNCRDQENMGILIITHDMGIAASLCDRILVMHRGRIIEAGEVDEIFYQPSQNYTKHLIEARKLLMGEVL